MSFRLTKELLEIIKGMHKVHIFDDETYERLINIQLKASEMRLKESVQQSKNGKSRVISNDELDDIISTSDKENRLP